VNKQNNNAAQLKKQAKANAVLSYLLEKLPVNLEETALTQGAIKRRRVLKSAADLLLSLMIYAISGMSLRVIAASAAELNFANMSDQAWQKRLVKCEPWLSHVLGETMRAPSCASKGLFKGKVVKLKDSSMVRQAGRGIRGGQTLRVHMCYNLTEGRMESVLVSDNHTAESMTIFSIDSNVIYIADAGYGKGKSVAQILSHGADALFRVTPNHLSLAEDQNGKVKIDMTKMLSAESKVIDFTCYVHTENKKYVPVRIIASRLPEDKALLARERKMRNAKKYQTKTSREGTFVYAEWVILMTTLGSECTVLELFELYRSRWQIELLFKRIKQSFKITKLPVASLQHSKVMVLLWLIIWAITERNVIGTEALLLEKQVDMTLYGTWAFHSFQFNKICAKIYSFFAISSDDSCDCPLDVLMRLMNHQSSRSSQYAHFRFA